MRGRGTGCGGGAPCEGQYSKVALPSSFALVHAIYKQQPSWGGGGGGGNGVKQIKLVM